MKQCLPTVFATLALFGCLRSSLGDDPPPHFVDMHALGSETGEDWCNAFTDLQDAITAAASDGRPIWVADGTYYPPSSGSTLSFQLPPGVKIYGGFDGVSTPAAMDCVDDGETELSQRDSNPLTNGTILSGDIDQDNTLAGNSATIVTGPTAANSSARLDGFKVTGATSHAIVNGNGSAIVLPTYANLWVVGNESGDSGAGVYNSPLSRPTFDDCRFESNTCDIDGGAMFSGYGAVTNITRCDFVSNTSVQGGGAVKILGQNIGAPSSANIIDCTFDGNESTSYWAGAIAADQSTITIRRGDFRYNKSVAYGGAVYLKGCTTVLVGSDFLENVSGQGGALYYIADNSGDYLYATNCTFTANEAKDSSPSNAGGVATIGTAAFTFVNCLFSDNTATNNGAALYIQINSTMQLINCTLANNRAVGDAGGLYVESGATTTVTNSIFWNNTDTNDYMAQTFVRDQDAQIQGAGTITTSYSCIDDGTIDGSHPFSVSTNIDSDPYFADPDGDDNTAGTSDDNFRLQSSSDCLDAGQNFPVPKDVQNVDEDNDTQEKTPDLDLAYRITLSNSVSSSTTVCSGTVDMGAYEYQCQGDTYGDMNDDSAKNGLDIQQFIECLLASDPDCICARGDFDTISYGVTERDIPGFVHCLLTGDCDAASCTVLEAEARWARVGLPDCNGNGIPDPIDIDVCEGNPSRCDCNGNGIPDGCDLANETSADANENSIPDECEPDCNDNNVPDDLDIANETSNDCDENGVPDECDQDCDNNDVPDACEMSGNDCDGNGVFDACDPDCDNDGVPDACELSGNDCDGNGFPDDCQVNPEIIPAPWTWPDCNNNDVPDGCELSGNDCNENGILDECDIANAVSDDENENGIPDECESESMMGGGGAGMMMMFGGTSAEFSEFDEYAAWQSYFDWCASADFSEMNNAEVFSALLAKRLELGLPAGQMLPE